MMMGFYGCYLTCTMYIVYKNCLQICPAVLYSNAGSILYAEFPRIGCKQEGSQIGNNKQNCHMRPNAKLYVPSTLNIDLILWHTQLIVCAENFKSWFKSWVFPFTFQAYILPHTLICMCVSLLKFHI